ncbi:MAG: hypothetical protein OXH16_13015 [Gemmatimonadetes bacterium]|nr:hypothetical protein [Gemmatimonadota bacterium]
MTLQKLVIQWATMPYRIDAASLAKSAQALNQVIEIEREKERTTRRRGRALDRQACYQMRLFGHGEN